MSYGHDATVFQATEDLNIRTYRSYHRGPNEYAVKRSSFEAGNLQLLLEAVNLTAERVALNDHIHDAQNRLVHSHVASHEDQAATRSPHGQGVGPSFQSFQKSVGPGKFADGRAFSAMEDQSVQSFQLLRKPHLDGFYSELFQNEAMFLKIALKRQNSYFHDTITNH